MSRALIALTAIASCCLLINQLAVMAQKTTPSAPPAESRQDDTQDNSVHTAFPEYISGDECLFCHRDIGATWQANHHQLTMRRASKDDLALGSLESISKTLASEVDFLLGKDRAVRFLKRSPRYGQVELLSSAYDPVATKMTGGRAEWEANSFADQCAGCHATAVDSATGAFSATSIDCVACHGIVDLGHSKDSKLVLLSKQNQSPQQVVSICGQCHLRSGQSRSSKRPYPNTFVAGDTLFRDFDVDLSKEAIQQLSAAERHIFENARDVELLNLKQTTCLSCHSVHKQSTVKHQQLEPTDRCITCHGKDVESSAPRYTAARTTARSQVCQYPMQPDLSPTR